MKKLMLIVVLSIMMGIAQVAVAQEANPAKVERKGNTFTPAKKETKSKEPIATPYKYTYEEKEYPIFIGPKGGCYILVPSKKTGEETKKYVDKQTSDVIRKEMGIEKTK